MMIPLRYSNPSKDSRVFREAPPVRSEFSGVGKPGLFSCITVARGWSRPRAAGLAAWPLSGKDVVVRDAGDRGEGFAQ
jgi:hypothetical protein